MLHLLHHPAEVGSVTKPAVGVEQLLLSQSSSSCTSHLQALRNGQDELCPWWSYCCTWQPSWSSLLTVSWSVMGQHQHQRQDTAAASNGCPNSCLYRWVTAGQGARGP